MSEIQIVIEQIFLLLIVGVIGFGAGRLKYLPASSDKVISSLIVKIIAPLMIFTNMVAMDFDARDYLNGVKIYFLAIVFVLLGYVISLLLRKICKVKGSIGRIFSMQMMFGNTLYFSMPLIIMLKDQLPDVWGKGIAYAMFFVLGNDTIMWTLGISLISSKEGDSLKTRLKHLLNPNSIAFILGVIAVLTGVRSVVSNIHLLDIFVGKLTDIGKMTSLLSMIFIGLMLSKLRLSVIVKEFKTKYILFVSSCVKLLLLPMLALGTIGVLNALFPGFMPIEPAKVAVMQLAMPGAIIVAALAGQYDSDPEFATEGIFVSTVLLIVTLPFILWMSGRILYIVL